MTLNAKEQERQVTKDPIVTAGAMHASPVLSVAGKVQLPGFS